MVDLSFQLIYFILGFKLYNSFAIIGCYIFLVVDFQQVVDLTLLLRLVPIEVLYDGIEAILNYFILGLVIKTWSNEIFEVFDLLLPHFVLLFAKLVLNLMEYVLGKHFALIHLNIPLLRDARHKVRGLDLRRLTNALDVLINLDPIFEVHEISIQPRLNFPQLLYFFALVLELLHLRQKSGFKQMVLLPPFSHFLRIAKT